MCAPVSNCSMSIQFILEYTDKNQKLDNRALYLKYSQGESRMPTYYWTLEIQNEYLGKIKKLRAETQHELHLKVQDQLRRWGAEETRLRNRSYLTNQQSQAEMMTQDAQFELNSYKSILSDTLSINDRLDWESLYDRTPYPPFTEKLKDIEYAPFEARMGVRPEKFMDRLFNKRRIARQQLIEQAKKNWETEKERERRAFSLKQEAYEQDKLAHELKVAEKNSQIDLFREEFENGHGDAIEKYVRIVLERSEYPESFEKEFEVSFEPISCTLVVNFQIPTFENFPHIESYRYVKTRDEIVEKVIKTKDHQKLFDDFVCQVTLRTIHEIFESVYIGQVQSVVFNGWVNGIDRSNGKPFESCIISVQVERSAFLDIELANVDPLQCVRSLRGLTAGPLHQIAPVRPIMNIHREDKRFVASQDVLDNIDDSMNLAEMDWEMFEHLVRELFSKIFSVDGAEVRVTQASRDGGVDAVAIDPDPIRGGKFIIQAKRYNNVVPASAVRDLYGTMQHERAAKGILVTTSYYGHDSREFVKDKPISLIDGSNLVYMLQEYGYKAKIELKN